MRDSTGHSHKLAESHFSCADRQKVSLPVEYILFQPLSVSKFLGPLYAWVAQQLREATPYGQAPKYLIRDNDSKFGSGFLRVATTSGIKLLKTPYHAPRANAICERFLRSARQECLDHLLILHERQLQRVLNAYVRYFNQARPHQGIHQQIPEAYGLSRATAHKGTKVVAVPILAGLHHDYRKVA